MEDAGEIWDEMPSHVRAAIDFLLDDGFQVVEATSGGMATGLVRLSGSDDVNATVSRDRRQWMFDFDLAGENLDLSTAGPLIREAAVTHCRCRSQTSSGGSVFRLDWTGSDDAVTRVEDAGQLRTAIRWP